MSVASAPLPAALYSKDQPFPARLLENRLLSKTGSAKETRHFVLSLAGSGLRYKAGDSLGIFPANREGEVAELLTHLGATGEEMVVLPRSPQAVSLREALTTALALSGPTRKLVELVATRATDPVAQLRLAQLLAPEGKDALAAYLAERHFIDVLHDFPSAHLDPQELVDLMRKLMPRLYSIASSPRLFPDEVHLTVVVVRYCSNQRERVGVCSTYLADRVPVNEGTAPVFVAHSHFGPPEDTARDVIMVGPGTGIAPFRGFLQDRQALGATGRNWLFFGDQRRACDYLYEEELEAWRSSGHLARLDLAFSRDQEHKVYVQDRMREHAAELWHWLEGGAYFYVCGDAKRMAKDVDAALHDIVAQQGGLDPAGAAEYVKQLKKERRYQRDVY
jgi:sulfite reductase (NADPH) flavoprotein alpha-component